MSWLGPSPEPSWSCPKTTMSTSDEFLSLVNLDGTILASCMTLEEETSEEQTPAAPRNCGSISISSSSFLIDVKPSWSWPKTTASTTALLASMLPTRFL